MKRHLYKVLNVYHAVSSDNAMYPNHKMYTIANNVKLKDTETPERVVKKIEELFLYFRIIRY